MPTLSTGIENMRYDFMPVGSVISYASDILPLGWLLCDGSEIDQARYPELYDLIGSKLPDYRGMFLRGNDNGRGLDPDRNLGGVQQPTRIPALGFYHSSRTSGFLIAPPYTAGSGVQSVGIHNGDLALSAPNPPSQDKTYIKINTGEQTPSGSASDRIAVAVRPINTSVNYIIKALHIANPTMEYQVANGLNYKIENNLVEQREAHLNNTGAPIGYNGITFIQDVGEKVAGKIYYDRLQPGLWYCKENTSEIVNSDKFEDWSNLSIYDNLGIYSETVINLPTSGNITFIRAGRAVTMTVDTYQSAIQSGYRVTIPEEYRPKLNNRVHLIVNDIRETSTSTICNVAYDKGSYTFTFPNVPIAHAGVSTWVI